MPVGRVREEIVVKQVTCPPCGAIIHASSDDELVAELQQHTREQHGMSLSRDQVLAMATGLRSLVPRVGR